MSQTPNQLLQVTASRRAGWPHLSLAFGGEGEAMGVANDIRFQCPHCSKPLRVATKLAGRRMPCPNPDCRQSVDIPLSLDAEPAHTQLPPTGRSPRKSAPDEVGGSAVGSTDNSTSPERPASHAARTQSADGAGEPPTKARVRANTSRKVMLFVAVGAAVLLCGFGLWYFVLNGTTDPFGQSGEAEDARRYTVRDASGVRASGNRESVLKTVGMNSEQIKSWADDPAGAAEGRAVGDHLVKVGGQAQFTIRNARGSVSSQNTDSASRASKMDPEQIREWVKDESAAGERRSATIASSGFAQIIWRDSSGRVRYTFRNANQFCTSSDQASGMRTLDMSDDQVRAWVEERGGARERRSASFSRQGFMEMISRGTMEEPPGLWR